MEKLSEEIIKITKDLQSLIKLGKKLNEQSLKNIGIDISIKSQDFNNLRISNDFWNGLKVSVINETNDLDNNPIANNKKLISRVKNLLENDKRTINFSDLIDLNIWTPAKQIRLGNIQLKKNEDIFSTNDFYEISLINDKKNIDGLWIDSAINSDRILDALHKFDLLEGQLKKMKELDLNKELELHLKKHFETIKKGGTSNQGLIDLIIGSNHNYGIEIKLAKELGKASASQKAIGQIELYTRQFNGNFMVIIAGLSSEKNEKSVLEVIRKAKDCKSLFYFLEAH